MLDISGQVLPIYVIGDSHALLYKNLVFREPWTGAWCVSYARYISGLTVQDFFSEAQGSFLPSVVTALEVEGLLRNNRATHCSTDEQDFNIARTAGRPVAQPLILITCGDIDIRLILLPMLKDNYDFQPPFETPYVLSDKPLLPWDICEEVLQNRIMPFVHGLDLLKKAGFERLYVQLVTPPTMNENNFERRHGYKCPASVRYKAVFAFNRMLVEHCNRLGVVVLDIWPQVTGPNGFLLSDFDLDGVHLTPDSANMQLSQMLAHAIGSQTKGVNFARYELWYRMALGEKAFDTNYPKPEHETERCAILASPFNSTNVRAASVSAETKSTDSRDVSVALAKFRQEGICIYANTETETLHWLTSITFDQDMANSNLAWDWAGPPLTTYNDNVLSALPSIELLECLRTFLEQRNCQALLGDLVGCPVKVINFLPVKRLSVAGEQTEVQSLQHSSSPAGVILGILHLEDVEEDEVWFKYTLPDGRSSHVTAKAGDLLLFDPRRLKYELMSPKRRAIRTIDLVFIPRQSDERFEVMTAGKNYWPLDPFSFRAPASEQQDRSVDARLTRTISTLNSRLESLLIERESFVLQKAHDRTAIAALKSSTSWRLTAPIRRLKRMVWPVGGSEDSGAS
jgi:hypothetical protein